MGCAMHQLPAADNSRANSRPPVFQVNHVIGHCSGTERPFCDRFGARKIHNHDRSWKLFLEEAPNGDVVKELAEKINLLDKCSMRC